MTNTTNLLNIATLANSCTTIKSQAKTSAVYKDFAKGAVVAGTGIINNSNVDNIISSVSNISGLSNVKNNSTVQNATSVVSGLSSILNALSK
jgi:hypothetical protein